MRDGKLRRRLVDGICLNGEIVQEKSEPVVVKLVYDISVRNDEYLFDCNYEQIYAPAGTYFMKAGKLRRRLVDGIFLNREIVQEKSEPVVVKLVYDISVKIVGGRVFYETHLEVLLMLLKVE
uniref:DUF1934 domain-containing protein n=1 Tax=Strongyloides papillosus TaxID=174720 RepID=A0A0N5BCF2_STREA